MFTTRALSNKLFWLGIGLLYLCIVFVSSFALGFHAVVPLIFEPLRVELALSSGHPHRQKPLFYKRRGYVFNKTACRI